MSTRPKRLSHPSGISRILDTQDFICSGKAKYGSPSMTITIPSTQRKKSICSSIHFSFLGRNNPELIVFLQKVPHDRWLAQRRNKKPDSSRLQSGDGLQAQNHRSTFAEVLRADTPELKLRMAIMTSSSTGHLFAPTLFRTEVAVNKSYSTETNSVCITSSSSSPIAMPMSINSGP